MALADLSADEVWRSDYDDAIRELAETGREFTSEDVRAIVGDPPEGTSPNAAGARFSAAAKRGEIIKVDYRNATRASLHAHPIAVWVGAA